MTKPNIMFVFLQVLKLVVEATVKVKRNLPMEVIINFIINLKRSENLHKATACSVIKLLHNVYVNVLNIIFKITQKRPQVKQDTH